MFGDNEAFASFSTNDIEKAKQFYGETLGVKLDEEMGAIQLDLAGGTKVFIYPKDDHEPASFTVLNFRVDDIDAAVDRLADAGVQTERYEGFEQDERGIARDERGPAIAWFKDPAGNVIAVLQPQ